MNRRELFAVGGAGIAGLLFPQTSKVESDRAVLKGLTDLEMTALIGAFPRENGLLIYWPIKQSILGVYSLKRPYVTRSYWVIEGTIVHHRTLMPLFEVTFDGRNIQKGWSNKAEEDVNVRSLTCCQFHPLRGDSRHYKRIVGKNGVAGWFLV